MKRLFVFLIFISLCLFGMGQSFANYSFEEFTGPTTLTITYTDYIEGVTVQVTDASTDSCDVYGNALTLDGKTFSHITLGPLEPAYSMGYAGKPVNYMHLNIQSGCTVRVSVVKVSRR